MNLPGVLATVVHLTQRSEELVKLQPGSPVQSAAYRPHQGEEEVGHQHVGALLDDLLLREGDFLVFFILLRLLSHHYVIIIVFFSQGSVKEEYLILVAQIMQNLFL